MHKNVEAIDSKIAAAEARLEETGKSIKDLSTALEKVQADGSAGAQL